MVCERNLGDRSLHEASGGLFPTRGPKTGWVEDGMEDELHSQRASPGLPGQREKFEAEWAGHMADYRASNHKRRASYKHHRSSAPVQHWFLVLTSAAANLPELANAEGIWEFNTCAHSLNKVSIKGGRKCMQELPWHLESSVSWT